jgi:uncharacterized protein involved in exopolysaccharide biosynthesis
MTYTAESVLRPQSQSNENNRLSGLAATFGVSLSSVAIGDPLRFQASVLQSRSVLEPVVLAQYEVANAPGSRDSTRGNLLDLLDIKGRSPNDRTLHGIDQLKLLMWVQVDPTSGLITLRVTTPWPALSLAVNKRLIEGLNTSNRERQQAAAESQAKFSGDRLAVEHTALDSAEDAQERFLRDNREYRNSPSLVLQFGRLQRRIDLLQQVVVSLAQSYEQSRIDAARDTPFITIIDSPEGSIKQASHPVRDGVVWALSAFFLLFLTLLARDAVERAMSSRSEVVVAMMAELRSLFRRGPRKPREI